MRFPYTFPFDFDDDGVSEGSRISDSILASALQGSEHLKAWDIMARDRFQSLDLTPILIYMIDTVPAVALPHLARQFDVLGVKGWKYALTEADQRSLLKQAIELHRYKGTPWSIREAARRIGFPNAKILEGYGQFYDGSFIHEGLVTYSGLGNWANFSVDFDLGNFKGITAGQADDLEELVNEYKNARSHCLKIYFSKHLTETVTMTDEVSFVMKFADIEDDFVAFYNGVFSYNSVVKHTAYAEEITGI